MKSIKIFISILLLLFAVVVRAEGGNTGADISKNAFAAVHTKANISDEEMIKQIAQAFMKANDVPGVAVEMYIDGKPSSYYFGYADRERKQRVTKNTIFELGSISKVMTSILLAQQVDFAQINLNDSIQKYIPALPESFDDITFRDLATHTAGLPFDVPNSIKTRSELDTYLSQWSPDEAPGDQWVYSNFGIGLLGYALETATHRDFNQLYRKRILSPLGMHDISLTISNNMKRFYAQGYDKNGKAIHRVHMDLFPAAGALKASAQDMQIFLGAAIGLPGTPPRLLYPIRMTQAAYVELPNYMQGLGWQIHEINTDAIKRLLKVSNPDFKAVSVKHVYDNPTFNGNDLIDKTGATAGFRAYIAVIPNKKSGIVLLANRNVSDTVFVKAAREILFKVTHLDSPTEKTNT